MILKGWKERIESAKKNGIKLTEVMKKELKSGHWVKLDNTHKVLSKGDVFVLGHQDVAMPAVVSKSSIGGVKCRLVRIKGVVDKSSSPNDSGYPIDVIQEWEFIEPNQTIPVYFDSPLQSNNDVWVEMLNPNEEDAIIMANVHGMFKSKQIR